MFQAYVKSSSGMLGKTAGCFNILARQMEDNTRKTSVRKVLGDVQIGEASIDKPDKKENDLHNTGMAQKKIMNVLVCRVSGHGDILHWPAVCIAWVHAYIHIIVAI